MRRTHVDYDLLLTLVGYQVRRAQLAVFDDFAATMKPLGLTPGQLGVLVLVRANPGLKQTEIGSALGFDRSSFVALLDRLEARALVVRRPSPHDRRSHALHLSDEGVRLLERAQPLLKKHEAQIAPTLSPAERATLLTLLAKIRNPSRKGSRR